MYFYIYVLYVCINFVNADLSFLTVGDWGAGPETGTLAGPKIEFSKTATNVAKQMGIVAALMSPPLNFVLNVGDNFYDDGLSSRTDPVFKTYFSNLFNAPSLATAPWYSALGNHDYDGDITAQYNRNSASSNDDPRWYMPAANYTIELQVDTNTKATVVVMDTNPFMKEYFACPSSAKMASQLTDPNAWKTQVTWLEQVLSKSPNAWKIVMAHENIFTSDNDHCYLELQSTIQPLLEKYKVAAYFSGHYHDLEVHNNNNVDYFTSGGGSQVDWTKISKLNRRRLLAKCDVKFTYGVYAQNMLYTPATLTGSAQGQKLPGFMSSTWTATAITTNVWTYMNSAWKVSYTRVTPLPAGATGTTTQAPVNVATNAPSTTVTSSPVTTRPPYVPTNSPTSGSSPSSSPSPSPTSSPSPSPSPSPPSSSPSTNPSSKPILNPTYRPQTDIGNVNITNLKQNIGIHSTSTSTYSSFIVLLLSITSLYIYQS